MGLMKHFPKSKKQAPGANGAGSKKAGKAGSGKDKSDKSASHKNKKQHLRTGAFSSLKSRQMLVDRIKRAIWASVAEINLSLIKLAKLGNLQAAKSLFDFAGVYSLPEPGDEEAQAAAIPAPVDSAAAAETQDPVDSFFRSIGISPNPEAGEPEMAAAGL